MKALWNTAHEFFGSRKNIVLSVAFSVPITLILAFTVFSATKGVKAAADVSGWKAPISPLEQFESSHKSDQQPAEVDLNDFGGMPLVGDLYGKVTVSGTTVDCNLYYGDGDSQLYGGAGTYTGAQLPGMGGVTLVAAHTGTFFRDLESVEVGADITVETRYGIYHYRVTNMEVVNADEFGQEDLDAAPRESFLMYTCYPFGQLTLTPQRYMVYGEYVSGPKVISAEEVAPE